MPLFKSRKLSKDESKRRVERCLVVARESPESSFDLSKCGTTEVPSGVFSLCKVLQKEVLLLYDNELSNLKGGGDFKDLLALRVLDLHDNFITSLPSGIGELKSLQVLNVQNNKLKLLPKSIGSLAALQTLNVQGNQLTYLPEEIRNLKSLRTLNASDNKIKALPPSLAHVRTLESIVVDVGQVTFPPKEIVEEGTASIMKFLCRVVEIDYVPPSRHLLTVLDQPNVSTASNNRINGSSSSLDKALNDTLTRHELEKVQRQNKMMLLEQQMQNVKQEQQALAAMASEQHNVLMDKIKAAEAEMDDGILWKQQQQDMQRDRKISALAADEQLANDTVAMILQVNERARNTEAILDEMEKERMQTEELLRVTQEETDKLRKQEVLVSMARLLESSENQARLVREYEFSRNQAASEAIEKSVQTDNRILHILNDQKDDRDVLIRELSNKEQAQIEAIQALQLQKDSKHCRITSQISMLQDELARLTLSELDKRVDRQDVEMRALQTKREAVSQLMIHLVDEQQKREDELMRRLMEMEQKRETDIEDYWLIQFQRLLDSKPDSLLEKGCDAVIAEVLSEADATSYAALFARHRITWEVLKSMTDKDLHEMGVRELGTRRMILKVLEHRLDLDKKASKKKLDIEKTEVPSPSPQPSAPVMEADVQLVENPGNMTTECVVCLDRKSSVVLLNCGHVCCCLQCSVSLTECPVCRSGIVKRVRIFIA